MAQFDKDELDRMFDKEYQETEDYNEALSRKLARKVIRQKEEAARQANQYQPLPQGFQPPPSYNQAQQRTAEQIQAHENADERRFAQGERKIEQQAEEEAKENRSAMQRMGSYAKQGAQAGGKVIGSVAGGAMGAGWGAARAGARAPMGVYNQLDRGKDPFLYIFLSILLFLSDMFWTKFNGVDWSAFSLFVVRNPMDVVWHLLTPIPIILFITYYLMKRPSMREWLSFAVLESLLIILFLFTGFSLGTIVHMIFIIFVIYFPLVRKMAKDEASGNYMLSLFIILDFFVISAFNDIGGFETRLIPVWFIAVLFFTNRMEKSPLTYVVIIGFIGFYIFGLVSYYDTDLRDFSSHLDPDATNEFMVFAQSSWNNFKTTVLDMKSSVEETINETKSIYEQDYYTGEIDKNAERQLGVEIERLKFGQGEIYVDEPLNIWTTLMVNTIEDDTISINSTCVADREEDMPIPAERVQPQHFIAYETEQVPIDCTFKRYTFNAGMHDVSLTSRFDFRTDAYQKLYFVNRHTTLAIAQRGENVLEHYGIQDTEPSTIYTSGPVRIGMGFRSNPVRVDTELSDDMLVMLGLTVDNYWDGEIVKVHNLNITLPPGTNLEEHGEAHHCLGYNFTCHQRTDKTICQLTQDMPKITEYKTLRCPVIIPDEEKGTVLGESPVSIMYARATITYDYVIERDSEFRVRESSDMKRLREETKASAPQMSIPDLYLQDNSTAIIDLYEYSSDKETTLDAYLTYTIEELSDTHVAICRIQDRHYLNCTAVGKGTETVEVSVDDLAQETRAGFSVTVGNISCGWPGLPSCPEDLAQSQGGDGTTDTQGLHLKRDLPSIILEGEADEFFFYTDSYVDGKGTLSYGFPADDTVYVGYRGDGDVRFTQKEGAACKEGYTYSFQVADEMGKKTYNLTFDLVCEACMSNCSACPTQTLCEHSAADCTYETACASSSTATGEEHDDITPGI